MKTLFITASLLFLGTGFAQTAQQKNAVKSQKAPNYEMRKSHQLEKMKTELSLTDEQTTKIKAIMDKRSEEMIALETKLKALKKAEREEISGVLTQEQKDKLKAMHHDKMQSREE
jgi:Spy/CpxP family protein refolding chaperone